MIKQKSNKKHPLIFALDGDIQHREKPVHG
jgi:hypothetical protein